MSLLTSLQIKHVAWRWSGTTRVYEATTLRVAEEDEMEEFTLSSLQKNFTTGGVWLYFQVESDHFRRVSPSGSVGNDWTDILTALRNPALAVDFFPIWDHDPQISYEVKLMRGRRNLLETNRTLFSPKTAISMEARNIVAVTPVWARTTRQK